MAANNIEEYNYELPESRIAKYPLAKRDESQLLVYKGHNIHSDQFKNILSYLPENSFLLFNNTKVICARMIFRKETGARIEIFLLEPLSPSQEIAQAMEVRSSCIWKCTIGNKRKWKDGTTLTKEIENGTLKAEIIDRENDLVKLSWDTDISFAELVNQSGSIPIPPYLNRENEEIDQNRYQTVYSNYEGAVAAPTAGLHFTDEILQSLSTKNIQSDFVTLHVSAGTFKPVQESNFKDHDMHNEQIIVSKNVIKQLIDAKKVCCVGTTSLRTLESLYWIGVKMMKNLDSPHFVEKLIPYQFNHQDLPAPKEVMNYLYKYLEAENKDHLAAQTEIFIFPGYQFHMCEVLITNFHLPKSTLLLLIAAFVGDKWKDIYNYALWNGFRFLSYGDSSILYKS